MLATIRTKLLNTYSWLNENTQAKDVIQADSPDREMQAIQAVSDGAKSDDDIAQGRIGGLDARQGRYYRRAGEVLGFLRRDAQNESARTALGRKQICSSVSGRQKRSAMVRALLDESVGAAPYPIS